MFNHEGLSNTAIPKYYGQFRERVMNGEIPVNQWVDLQMKRIDDNIRNPGIYYDPRPVEGYIAYCEEELTLNNGEDVHMPDTFKLWAEDLLCWYYFEQRSSYVPGEHGSPGYYAQRWVKKRLINKQILMVGRSAAKTWYVSSIHMYFLNVDGTTTDQIVTAPTIQQAELTLLPAKAAIKRAKGPMFKFLTHGSPTSTSQAYRPKLMSTKKGIENSITGSVIRALPMSIDKLQGLGCKVGSVDEWLSGDVNEDVIGALEQGAMKIDDYVILATSSEGTVRNGIGDTIKIECKKILKGEYINPHVSIWYYCLDDIKEVAKPEMWLKANPNLGVTVSYESYQLDVEKAEHSPSNRNDILAKRFGIPLEGLTYFFTYEETKVHNVKRDYWGMPCAMGADLSKGDDFCAFTFLFPLGDGSFGVKTRSYITSKTLNALPTALRIKYEQFLNEGTLIVFEGAILDMDNVFDDLDSHITQREYDVQAFGYDPYNANEFVKRWTTEINPFGVTKVIQGSKTESVPLGELKKLAQDRLLIFDEELMSFAMNNSIVIEDTNGNRKLQKKRADQKIDNVAALMDAFVAYKRNKEMF